MNLFIILLCTIWGSNWVFMKLSGDYFPPVMFSALRFVLASVIMLGIVRYKRIPLPRRQDWKWYALCGLLQTTYPYLVNQISLGYTHTGIVSVLAFTMPFWLLILSHFFLHDRITPPKLIGLLVGIAGLFLVMDINPLKLEWSGIALLMEGLVLTGAVGWALANLIIKKHLQHHDIYQFTAWQMVIGTLGLLLYALLFEHGQPVQWNGMAVICLIYAGILSSALGFLLWTFILSKGEATKVSVSLLFVPVIGTLCSWIFLGETLTWSSALGIIAVAAGIGIVNMRWNPGKKQHTVSEYENLA